MKRNRLCKLAVTFTLGFALLAASGVGFTQKPPQASNSAPANGGTFRIAGVAVSSISGAPLERARISIINTRSPREVQGMISGEDGRFAFENLAPGKYSLVGGKRGFLNTSYEQHEQFSTAIVTGAGLDTENLILRLVPMAAITGKVLDESGEPVRNASVRLYRENRGWGFRRVTPAEFGMTDDQGNYECAPIGPGTYFVAVSATPWYAVHAPSARPQGVENLPSVVDPALDASYPTTYYAGVTEADFAAPIIVKGGDRVHIDMHLEPAPALHVLFHFSGNPQNGFRPPTLEKRMFDSVENIGTETLSISGDTYELIGVPAGKYTVRLPGAAPDGPDQSADLNLTKDGQELDTSTGEALGKLTVSVKSLREGRIPPQLMILVRDAGERVVAVRPVDQTGEVTFEDLRAGKYSLMASGANKPYAVVHMSSQGGETMTNSFNLTPGASVSLSAIVASANARVEGFVQRSGKPASGVMVVLVPTGPESQIDFFRRDQSDLDGSFVLHGVVPGSYTVIAIEDGWTLDWSQPAVLQRYTATGQKVSITRDTQGSVHLPDPVEVQAR